MLIVLLFLVFKVVIPFVKNKLEANDQKEIEKIQELTSSEKKKRILKKVTFQRINMYSNLHMKNLKSQNG